MQKIKWFLLIKNDYLFVIRIEGLHFCIMELGIGLNCSDYLWSWTKLVDYPEVTDNLQDKIKCLLLSAN